MKLLAGLLFGIGFWFVGGTAFDWFLRKVGIGFPDDETDLPGERWRKAAEADSLITRVRKRGLPWGTAALALGIALLIVDA